MSLSSQTGIGSRVRAELGLYAFLFLLFLAYRAFYWRDDLPDAWLQVVVNSGLDVLLVFGLQRLYRWLINGKQINRFLLFACWVGFGVLGSVALRYMHYYGHLWTVGFDPQFMKTFQLIAFQVFDSFIVVMIGFSLGTAFHLLVDWNEARLRISALETERALAEINYLRSQVNPHFVFNTLNSIFFLIKADNDPARDALHTFSDMLRYQLYESNQPKVPIEDEIHYLRNYIYLQKLRHEEDVEISFQVADDLGEIEIVPMLLIIPIENAFKHLSHWTDKPNRVEVELKRINKHLCLETLNTTDVLSGKELGGIGLGNLKRRLTLLYPGQHELDIHEAPHSYHLKLLLAL